MIIYYIFVTVLLINFNVLDYIITENGTLDNIGFQFQAVQNPFTLIFTPVNISTAEELGLGSIISSDAIYPDARATAGNIMHNLIRKNDYPSLYYT